MAEYPTKRPVRSEGTEWLATRDTGVRVATIPLGGHIPDPGFSGIRFRAPDGRTRFVLVEPPPSERAFAEMPEAELLGLLRRAIPELQPPAEGESPPVLPHGQRGAS
jgi:hypothetical protein